MQSSGKQLLMALRVFYLGSIDILLHVQYHFSLTITHKKGHYNVLLTPAPTFVAYMPISNSLLPPTLSTTFLLLILEQLSVCPHLPPIIVTSSTLRVMVFYVCKGLGRQACDMAVLPPSVTGASLQNEKACATTIHLLQEGSNMLQTPNLPAAPYPSLSLLQTFPSNEFSSPLIQSNVQTTSTFGNICRLCLC